MLNRKGLTLVELLVSLVLVGIVGLATMRLVQSMLNATAAQVEIAAAATSARTGAIAIPQELREIGFDTIPLAGQTVSDFEAIGTRRVTFHAMRGAGVTCGTPTLTEFRLLRPAMGLREPLPTDGFLLFVESDPNFAGDDQWVPVSVAAIDYHSSCGADSAIALTLSAVPVVDPASGTAMAISQYFVGGPVRWFERIEYGPIIDPRTGRAFVGVRSLSLGEPELAPLIGPLADTLSFTFNYFGATGAVLDPVTANPVDVRSIGLELTAATAHPASLAGTTRRTVYRVPVSARVALRNTLRP